MKKHIVVLSGAGVSAESGLKTFRDADGLWEEYKIEEVASIQGWFANPALVIEFYNKRRAQLQTVEPNVAHTLLADLEKDYKVTIVTQNVDNLHERGGSSNIIHLHGELTKITSVSDDSFIKDIGYANIQIGDTCPKGYQLRPYIVWFGEAVPKLQEAADVVATADYLVVLGTSLQVYPAASLVNYASKDCKTILIDPHPPVNHACDIVFDDIASVGVAKFVEWVKSQ